MHRDIKPENLVWGIYENNNVKNNNKIYLIDFGESNYIGRLFFGEEEQIYKRKGTRIFLSINSHINAKCTPTDDIESMAYTLLYISKKGLPWTYLSCPSSNYYKETLKMKINFRYYSWCGRELEFLAVILEYLKIVRNEKRDLKYVAIKAILNPEFFKKNDTINLTDEFDFVKEIKDEIEIHLNNKNEGKNINEKLNELFKGYPIDFSKLYKELK